jgi:hypothetical protein
LRIVADTNLIVSAFLWGGTPVLSRSKFAERLRRARFSAAFLLARYTQLATLIATAEPLRRSQ